MSQGSVDHIWSTEQMIRMNAAFRTAMLSAIARHREHCLIGTVTAPGTANPIFYLPSVSASYVSPAHACRLLGEMDGHEAQRFRYDNNMRRLVHA